MLQVFESSADHISKEQFAEVSLPYCKYIRDTLRDRLKSQNIEPVPMVIFAKGGGHSLKEQSELGFEVVGLDWTVDPVDARNAVGPNVTLQGNLDPQDLYKSPVSKYNHFIFQFRVLVCRLLNLYAVSFTFNLNFLLLLFLLFPFLCAFLFFHFFFFTNDQTISADTMQLLLSTFSFNFFSKNLISLVSVIIYIFKSQQQH